MPLSLLTFSLALPSLTSFPHTLLPLPLTAHSPPTLKDQLHMDLMKCHLNFRVAEFSTTAVHRRNKPRCWTPVEKALLTVNLMEGGGTSLGVALLLNIIL